MNVRHFLRLSDLSPAELRALLQRAVRQDPPIQAPDAFAEAISAVAPPIPLPEPAPPISRGRFDPRDGSPREGYDGRGGYGQRDGR